MKSSFDKSKKEDKHNYVAKNILSVGYLNLKITILLLKNEFLAYKIDNILSIEDIYPILNDDKIDEKCILQSENISLEAMKYINKSFKFKSYIEYFSLEKIIFTNESNELSMFFNKILKKNLISICYVNNPNYQHLEKLKNNSYHFKSKIIIDLKVENKIIFTKQINKDSINKQYFDKIENDKIINSLKYKENNDKNNSLSVINKNIEEIKEDITSNKDKNNSDKLEETTNKDENEIDEISDNVDEIITKTIENKDSNIDSKDKEIYSIKETNNDDDHKENIEEKLEKSKNDVIHFSIAKNIDCFFLSYNFLILNLEDYMIKDEYNNNNELISLNSLVELLYVAKKVNSKLDVCLLFSLSNNEYLKEIKLDFLLIIIKILKYTNTIFINKIDAEVLFSLITSNSEMIKQVFVHNNDLNASIVIKNNSKLIQNKKIKKELKILFVELVSLIEHLGLKTQMITVIFDKLNNISIMSICDNILEYSKEFKFEIIQKVSVSLTRLYDNHINIIDNNFSSLISSFLGTFLSRFIQGKSFEICFLTGQELLKRIYEITKLGIDLPLNDSFYLVLLKNKIIDNVIKKIDGKEDNSSFLLDCTNKNTSFLKPYNSLFDSNLIPFFTNKGVRKQLIKQGIIEEVDQNDCDFKHNINNIPTKQLKIIQELKQKKMERFSLPKILNNNENKSKLLENSICMGVEKLNTPLHRNVSTPKQNGLLITPSKIINIQRSIHINDNKNKHNLIASYSLSKGNKLSYIPKESLIK